MAVIDRIKFNGLSRDWLIYRYPQDDFVTGSQLIVGEGQVAVFVKGGQALDYFTAGTYTLQTSNLPLIQGLLNLPYGGKTPFTAEIYFINATCKLDIYWGTSDPIQLIDPKYHVKLRVRAFGQFGLKVADYRVLLTELIGTMSDYEVVSFDKISSFFKGVLIVKVKSLIAQAIINNKISALEITANINEISEYSKQEIGEEFDRFGMKVVNFFIQSINFPDEDFDAINKILQDKAAFDIIGDSRYVSKRSFDVMESAATNTGGGVGAFVGAGVGLGAGLGMGGVMSGAAATMDPQAALRRPTCPKCGAPYDQGDVFCSNCGNKLLLPQMKCPKCGNDVDGDAKFCSNCGTAVRQKLECPSCHNMNDIGTRFCSECGCKLEG